MSGPPRTAIVTGASQGIGAGHQIVPVKDSARKSARLIKGATEIYYPGTPHGLTAPHADLVSRDLLAYLRTSVCC